MAGGQGTRFWPWSTEERPKQFLEVIGGQSLLAQTYRRLAKLIVPRNIYVVAAPRYRDAVRKCLPGFSGGNFIAEPVARNTAPALILANIRLSEISEEINLLVTPADHYIRDERMFSLQLKDALACADTRCIITAGVKPVSPHTGYGYIQFNRRKYRTQREEKFFQVEEFKEKPDEKTARTYIQKGNYFWNSGLFVYKLRFFKEFILAHSPYYGACYRRLESFRKNENRLASVFASIRPESIDYALMEKMDEARMFEARFGWNDVGSWSSVYEINQKNRDGNVIKGNTVAIDTSDSLVFSVTDKPLAVVGLRDMAIIQTDSGLLVSKMHETQKVKQVSALLKKRKIRNGNRRKREKTE